MDDALSSYDESLQALEKQRESLELVMKRMGAEWEESGAGIGWLGDIMSNVSDSDQQDSMVNAAPSSASSYSAPHSSSSILLKNQSLPLFHMMQTNAGPSHDYLQTLLNVNDELLAQSLASSANMEGEIDPDSSNTLSNTREYNITISTPPSSSNINNTNAFVVQQQLQLISPPLAEHDHQDAENIHSLLYSQQLQQDPLKPAIPPSTQQPQLITPPITPPEE
ncbi:unnamed protein product [Mucor circinelloides]|uniref:Uncharacterized protein n=1 Tax=Mucor circinelloides f. circinelloides (strain 1006PhL) TaxID=1220926 RepID=S2IZD2_MUCC1|nr:hypothetical protein HMPREF1544_10600 [Mucor circinelloides 1006PhL]